MNVHVFGVVTPKACVYIFTFTTKERKETYIHRIYINISSIIGMKCNISCDSLLGEDKRSFWHDPRYEQDRLVNILGWEVMCQVGFSMSTMAQFIDQGRWTLPSSRIAIVRHLWEKIKFMDIPVGVERISLFGCQLLQGSSLSNLHTYI